MTVDAFDGVRALAHLGDDSGPFIEDRAAATTTWLVAPGCAAGWVLRGVRLRGLGHWLTVPPIAWEGSARWRRVPPGRRGWLTRPTLLRAALGAVLLPTGPGRTVASEPYRPQIDWPPDTPEHIQVPIGYCTCGCRLPLAECEPTSAPKPRPESER
ncbi:hypothetical protein [Streptomyces sp. B6B3]|uniref:hypothetical protein n=1 Tax=Streptomyces sp. B6B3 TaxID=3153570 RepID=UPI00325F6B82